MDNSSSPHPVLAITDLMALKARCRDFDSWGKMRCPCCGSGVGVGLYMDDGTVFDLCLVCFAVVEVPNEGDDDGNRDNLSSL